MAIRRRNKDKDTLLRRAHLGDIENPDDILNLARQHGISTKPLDIKGLLTCIGIDVEYKLVNTGIKKKINDWNTVKYNLKADEKLMSEIWAAPYSSVGISESDMNVMKSFSNFMKDMVKSVPMAQKDPFSAVYDEFKGVPIKTLNKTSNSVSELVSVKDYTPKDSDFIVPSGYEEKKIPMNGGR